MDGILSHRLSILSKLQIYDSVMIMIVLKYNI